MSDKWVRAEASNLLAMAEMVLPEGEPLELIDREYSPKQMAQLRAHLSSIRSGCDAVNNALARSWSEDHDDETYNDGTLRWWVGRTKAKRFIPDSGFFDWLATLDAARLASLVNPNTVKVTGLTPAERETFFDESKRTDRLSIQNKPLNL